jgi:hypothetical protein
MIQSVNFIAQRPVQTTSSSVIRVAPTTDQSVNFTSQRPVQTRSSVVFTIWYRYQSVNFYYTYVVYETFYVFHWLAQCSFQDPLHTLMSSSNCCVNMNIYTPVYSIKQLKKNYTETLNRQEVQVPTRYQSVNFTPQRPDQTTITSATM